MRLFREIGRWVARLICAAGLCGPGVLSAIAQAPTANPPWTPAGATYDAPLFESSDYDPAVPTPESLLGFRLGDRPATHAQVAKCLAAWSGNVRQQFHEYGRTHEGRLLFYMVITSPRNQERLAAIREGIGKLADPRKLGNAREAEALIRDTPAVAWMAYCIHGDEMSGTDAALGLIYHLLAARDAETLKLLDALVICVDPLMNPDGRDRFIQQVDQAAGYTPNFDLNAVQHGGRWPHGRTNHYLFDMNRDWILGVCPETRGRRTAIGMWNPQLLVDGHEMSGHDTFLFYPPREPFNPHTPATLHKWWKTFADEQGAAFDQHGWSYYTREWADYWYPGYSDGYGSFMGAIAILYEQANIGGRTIRQDTGALLTYREAVHHQAVSSIANLRTLAANRVAVLTDFHAHRRAGLEAHDERFGDTFVLPAGGNVSRKLALLENLHNQGIEIGVAQAAFTASGTVNTLGAADAQREFPAGSFVIQRRQPLAALVGVNLDFDPRMDDAFLNSERRELETKGESRLYDITGWSLPMAYGLEAYWCHEAPLTVDRFTPADAPAGLFPLGGNETHPPYGYVIDGTDDRVLRAAAALLQHGAVVRVADEAFRVDGREFPRGSLLTRRHENGAELRAWLQQLAANEGIEIVAAYSARSPDAGPDLGGQRFLLLRRPKAALLGGAGVDTYCYGSLWHLLDHEIGLDVSLYDVHQRGDLDLRRFNVVILPGGGEALYKPLLDDLKTWIEQGGTLVAVEGATSAFIGKDSEFSDVRDRRDVLGQLREYADAAARERAAGRTPIDPQAVWDAPRETPPASAPATESDDADEDEAARTARDEYRRRFSPQGTIVRGELTPHHWLTLGCPVELPLHVAGSRVLLAKEPGVTAVRLAAVERLRLSGLLWPEAAARLADSAYATVERLGRGQLVLFAQEPDFRGTWRGTRRLFVNAVLFGPGCGASQPEP